MEVEIKTAGPGDIESLMPLFDELYRLYGGDVGPNLQDIITEYVVKESHFVCVAIAGEKPVGVIVGSYRLDIDYECRAGLVDSIAVTQQYRSRGVGKRLVSEFADWAKARGCKVLQVLNGKRQFFEPLGFKKRPAALHQKTLCDMMDFSPFQGIGQFGPAYRIMLENDPHAPGSVDHVLIERMTRIYIETADCLYEGYTATDLKYQTGSRPQLEQYVKQAGADEGGEEDRLAGICRFCAERAKGATEDLDEMRFGGTEEQIIDRRGDWCTDVARSACALCQVAGLPGRLIWLADTERAYSGHAIIEVYRDGAWGAADPTTNVVYRKADGRPASTWELMNDPAIIETHRRGESTPYTTADQFRAAAVANYFVWEYRDYDYTVSPINAYYRSILRMSADGWPDGLRWLHGEEKGCSSSS